MSRQVADISTLGFTVGITGSIPPAPTLLPVPTPTITQQMRYETGADSPHLVIFNESPCKFMLTIPNSNQTLTLPSGRWVSLALPANEDHITYIVQDIGGNALFNKLSADFYTPGEPVDPLGVLGNSPIGGSVVTPSSPANAFEQDLLTNFVFTGLICTKDGTVANQLDVTAGLAFLKQADASLGRVPTGAVTFTTAVPSTTYFLDLNPDGTFSFGTSHSVVSNHLSICQLTTDVSGNISVITDVRITTTALLNGMIGLLAMPPMSVARGGRGVMGNIVAGDIFDVDSNGSIYLKFPSGGAAGLNIQSPNGTTVTSWGGAVSPFGALTRLNGQTAVGFGQPVLVAQAIDTIVTTTGDVTLLTFVPVTGWYRISGGFEEANGSATTITFRWTWGDTGGGTPTGYFLWNPAATTPNYLNAFSVASGGHDGYCPPMVFRATAGTNIIAHWNNSAGTPNDKISVFIERLA